MVVGTENVVVPVDSGHTRLNELGYKQELKRDLSYVILITLHSFCSAQFLF